MTRRELQRLLRELGVQPSRRLGQNFLVDRNTLHWMMRQADPRPGEWVLEIGPGTGILTDRLIAAGANVVAIEYDARLVAYLERKYDGNHVIRIIQGDAARTDFDDINRTHPYKCMANLPYSASTNIISRFLATENRPGKLFLLLQSEMAARLAASPGSKVYGALSVQAQALYDVSVLRTISASVFWPEPGVDSAFVEFDLQAQPIDPVEYRHLAKLVRQAFSQRRKKLINVLKSGVGSHRLAESFQALGLDGNLRAEDLTVDQFIALARRLEIRDAGFE